MGLMVWQARVLKQQEARSEEENSAKAAQGESVERGERPGEERAGREESAEGGGGVSAGAVRIDMHEDRPGKMEVPCPVCLRSAMSGADIR
eukprot:2958788-Rhodomonas_salina.1